MLMMVTGGSGSGKSEFAESLVTGLADGPNLYIATMFPFDEECPRHGDLGKHGKGNQKTVPYFLHCPNTSFKSPL